MHIKVAQRLELGDTAGHPFHGNQYTGGIGGKSPADDPEKFLADHPRKDGEALFDWQARIIDGLSQEDKNAVLFKVRERYDPCAYIRAGAERWNAEHGLPPIPNDLIDRPVDLEEADKVARYFEEAPDQSGDPKVQQAYEDFKAQSAEMFDYMTKPENEGGMGIEVDFVHMHDPYKSATEQANDLRDHHHIFIESGLGGDHTGTMTRQEYDDFRAVHDVFGHAGVGGGFDRHGEYEAWLMHSAMYTGLGQQAMSTEYHGVNSALWSGAPSTPGTGKSILLPEQYAKPPWDRSSVTAAARDKADVIIDALGLDNTFSQKYDHPEWHFANQEDAVVSSVQPLELGDVAGHDFHGNQWTGGKGGEGKDAVAGSTIRGETGTHILSKAMLKGTDLENPSYLPPGSPFTWIQEDDLGKAKAEVVKAAGEDIANAARNDPDVRDEMNQWGRTPEDLRSSLEQNWYDVQQGPYRSADGLSNEQLYGEWKAQEYVDSWANSAADTNPVSLALQSTTSETLDAHSDSFDEFLRNQSALSNAPGPNDLSDVQSKLAQDGNTMSAFVQGEYDRTQKYLADNGITELSLARGVSFGSADPPSPFHEDGKYPMDMNPASSWSVDKLIAQDFAGGGGGGYAAAPDANNFMLSATFPARDIISTSRTGQGAFREGEVIVRNQPNGQVYAQRVVAESPDNTDNVEGKLTFFGIQQKAAYIDDHNNADWIKRVSRRVTASIALEFGDVVGHEFHGNQYTAPQGTVMYHSSKTRNRESILKTGLEANRSLGGKNSRVYMDSVDRGPDSPRPDSRPHDVYRVDVSGLPLVRDPELPERWSYSEHDISPDRITLLHPGTSDEEWEKWRKTATFGDTPGHEFHGNQWTGPMAGANAHERELADKIRANLTDELRKPKYRGNPDLIAGQCYVASEALYHLLGGKEAGYKPMFLQHEGEPHWFLKGPRGERVDATSTQFKTPVPYDEAKGKGFLTKEPSARARELMSRITSTASVQPLELGDVSGHLFHGNQYTGGISEYDASHTDAVKFLEDGKARFITDHGMTATPKDFQRIVALPTRGRQIMDDYNKLPVDDPEAHAAYQQLSKEVNEQYDYLTKDLGVKVSFTDKDPYKDVTELRAALDKHELAVLKTETTGPHPLFTNEENDKFRAVHDAFGHAAIGRGFDRNGEEAAFQSHAQMFSPLATRALATETRGQNSVLVWGGQGFPPQKVALLPEADSVVASAQPVTQEDADADNNYDESGCHHTSLGRWFKTARVASALEFTFDETEPRDERGRWSSRGDEGVASRTRREGGMTYDPKTGKEPTTGFLVAKEGVPSEFIRPPERFIQHEAEAKAILKDFIKQNAKVFDEPNSLVGIWHDKAHNEVTLDVMEQLSSREEVILAGVERNQQSIWDVEKSEAIPTGGTGNRE